jgi:ABC-type sugar transport system permease subunit
VLRELLRSETAAGVEIWREIGDTAVLDRLFAGRWNFSDETDRYLDEATLSEGGAGLVGKAAVYDADSWFQLGTFSLAERAEPTDLRFEVDWPAVATSVFLLAVVCLLLSRKKKRPHLHLLVALIVLLAVFRITWSEENRVLEEATTARLGTAANGLKAVPDLETVLARPGGVYTLTGLNFILRDAAGETEFSSLPSAATEDLERIPAPVEGRYRADRIEYAVVDLERVRLVMLPYEASYGSASMLVALAILGVLIAALPAYLLALVDEPLVFRSHLSAWSFLSPSFILLGVTTVGPLLFAAWLSLHRWSLIDQAKPFVGLDNYLRLLGDSSWWNAVRNTAFFTLHVPIAMAVALGLALLVERPRRGIVLLRTILFLPGITSLVAVAIAWQWMLHDEYGLINWMMSLVGLGPVRWLTSTKTALVAIMMLSVWMVVGYQIVLFQAGLAAIPRELYDAARMDGAGPWRRFLHVTLPGLRHTLSFVLVTSVIGSFQVFGAVYVMTEGGPLHATDVAVFHIYEEAWEFFRFGDAAAMSWILFAIIFVVTWLHFRLLERRAEEP